jgi:hypothetical protein
VSCDQRFAVLFNLPWSSWSKSGDKVDNPDSSLKERSITSPVTETTNRIRLEFYEAYKRQAKIFDRELKEYNKELNVTLLFVSDPI